MPLTWHGDEVLGAVRRAEFLAVNETTRAAAAEAERDHWWENQSDRLEQNTISEPARFDGLAVAGRFGTTRRGGFYGLILEYKRPFLRPVADRIFPSLHERLRKYLEL